MNIRHGGELKPGDFILIANNGYTDFGWYFGQGRGTIQYFNTYAPRDRFEQFKEYQSNSQWLHNWTKDLFKRHEFSTKSIYKSYIYGGGISLSGSRVVKIENPGSGLTGPEDLKRYKESKEALLSIKFPAK